MRCLSCNSILSKSNMEDPRHELCLDCYALVNLSLTEFDENGVIDHTIFNGDNDDV